MVGNLWQEYPFERRSSFLGPGLESVAAMKKPGYPLAVKWGSDSSLFFFGGHRNHAAQCI